VAGFARTLQQETRQLGMLRPLVALPDLGGLSLVLREAEIIDVAGLADYAVAHAPGREAIGDYLLSEGLPSFLDVHGPSGYLRHLGPLMAHYRPFRGSTYVLAGLTPTSDPRCPGGKATIRDMPDEALVGRLAETLSRDVPQAIRLWRCAVTYREPARLPAPSTRQTWARSLEQRAGGRATEGALRQLSLATLLLDGEAGLRRKTEALRARLHPSVAR